MTETSWYTTIREYMTLNPFKRIKLLLITRVRCRTENNLVIIAACIPTLRPLITSTSKLYSAYTGRNMTVEPKSSRKLAYPQRRSYRRHSDLSRDSELAVLESHAKSSSASCTIVPVGDAEDYEWRFIITASRQNLGRIGLLHFCLNLKSLGHTERIKVLQDTMVSAYI